MIIHKGKKYCLVSKKKDKEGHRKNLGCYPSKSGAENREREVNYFKHLKEMIQEEIELLKEETRAEIMYHKLRSLTNSYLRGEMTGKEFQLKNKELWDQSDSENIRIDVESIMDRKFSNHTRKFEKSFQRELGRLYKQNQNTIDV